MRHADSHSDRDSSENRSTLLTNVHPSGDPTEASIPTVFRAKALESRALVAGTGFLIC